MHSKEHWETFCEGNGSFTPMMQKTREKQNALPAPGLKNMVCKVTSRYTAKLTCSTKMLDPMTETKRGNFGSTHHTHIWYVCLVPRPWTAWVRHGIMGLKCVNVPRVMRVDAPSFRSMYLTIATFVGGQKTKGNLKAGPATYRFGAKVYWWCVGREKRNLQGHLGVCRSLLGGHRNMQQATSGYHSGS